MVGFLREKLIEKEVCVFTFIVRYILCARTLMAVLICGEGKGGRKKERELEKEAESCFWGGGMKSDFGPEIMKSGKNVERYVF